MWGLPMCFKSRVFFAAAAAIHRIFSLYSLQNGPNSNDFPILSMKMSESQMQTIKKKCELQTHAFKLKRP